MAASLLLERTRSVIYTTDESPEKCDRSTVFGLVLPHWPGNIGARPVPRPGSIGSSPGAPRAQPDYSADEADARTGGEDSAEYQIAKLVHKQAPWRLERPTPDGIRHETGRYAAAVGCVRAGTIR